MSDDISRIGRNAKAFLYTLIPMYPDAVVSQVARVYKGVQRHCNCFNILSSASYGTVKITKLKKEKIGYPKQRGNQ
jgi:hypothetical protein